jgi:hypothetical protein
MLEWLVYFGLELQARFKPGLGARELKHFNMAMPGRIPY